MTRKKYIKSRMALGISRNQARKEAAKLVLYNENAALANKRAAESEWQAILRFIDGDRSVSLEPIRREDLVSYYELWQSRQQEA